LGSGVGCCLLVLAVFVSAEVFRWGGDVGGGLCVIYRGGGLVGWWGRFVGGGWRGGGGGGGGRMRDLYLGEVRENESKEG